MKNKTEVIISNTFTNRIFFPDKCEVCKCFQVLPENHSMRKLMHFKYNCFVKEGDNYCDYIQKEIDSFREIERIEDMENIEDRKDAMKKIRKQ